MQSESIVSYVLRKYPTTVPALVDALSNADYDIITFADFLEFLAWWGSRDDFRMNAFKSPFFGVVQQYRGLLTMNERDYVKIKEAYWPTLYGEVRLRNFLNDVRSRFG